jgi:hypothetical protein
MCYKCIPSKKFTTNQKNPHKEENLKNMPKLQERLKEEEKLKNEVITFD